MTLDISKQLLYTLLMNILRTYERNLGWAEYDVVRMQTVYVVDSVPTLDSPQGMYEVVDGTWFKMVKTWTGAKYVARVTKHGGIIY